MKKRTKKIVFWAVLVPILIITLVIINFTGYKDCSKQYETYKEVKGFSTVSQLEDYLTKSKKEYSISNNILSIKDTSIKFTIDKDKSCVVKKNVDMQAFETLDKEDFSKVTVEGNLKNGKIHKIVKYTRNKTSYLKNNNNYYKLSNITSFIFMTIFFWCTFSAGVLCYYLSTAIFSYFKKRKKQKQPKTID